MDDHGNALVGVLYALLVQGAIAVVALLLYIILT